MAYSCRAIIRNSNIFHILTKPGCWTDGRNFSIKVISSGICYNNTIRIRQLRAIQQARFISSGKCCSQNQGFGGKNCWEQPVGKPLPDNNKPKPEEKQSVIQRFKQMYKDYWYVLLPVHLCTSVVWFGSFYYAVRSGVDVLAILESIGVSEKILEPVRNSEAGYLALAFAIYKVTSPLRYAVTLGGTTFAIKKLQGIGWIKPVPSRERLKEMFQEKKDVFQDRYKESKQHCQTQIKKAKSTIFMDEMSKYRSEMRSMKNKVKKM